MMGLTWEEAEEIAKKRSDETYNLLTQVISGNPKNVYVLKSIPLNIGVVKRTEIYSNKEIWGLAKYIEKNDLYVIYESSRIASEIRSMVSYYGPSELHTNDRYLIMEDMTEMYSTEFLKPGDIIVLGVIVTVYDNEVEDYGWHVYQVL